MTFVKAQVGPPNVGDPESMFTVHYFDEHGKLTIRSGGKRAWRCNNPGNLVASPYSMSKDRRAIGKAGDGEITYAVYPDYATGHEALVVMLKGSVYSPLTLRAAIWRYDKRNPNYINQVVAITGFDPERRVKSLNDEEFERFWKAIEFIERWEVGREDFIEKWYITGVHKIHGVISEYYVHTKEGERWIPKMEAINFALEQRLHAVLVRMKKGACYLRPEFGVMRFMKVTK